MNVPGHLPRTRLTPTQAHLITSSHILLPQQGIIHETISHGWLEVRPHSTKNPVKSITTQEAAHSTLPSGSNTTAHTHLDSHTPNSNTLTHPSHLPSPPHRTIGFALESLPGIPGVKLSPCAAHLHFDANKSKPPRSGTSLSMKYSRLFVSQNFRNLAGRASYRAHRGSPARFRTPASNEDAPVLGPPSSPTLRRAGPGDLAVPGTVPVPPSADDPNQPGEPIRVYRFCPISVSNVLRYDHRKIR